MASTRSAVCLLLTFSGAAASGPLLAATAELQQKNFLEDTVGVVTDATDSIAKEAEKATSKLEDTTGEAGRAALDAAIKATQKCPYLYEKEKRIPYVFGKRLSKAFQGSSQDPSVDEAACGKVVRSAMVAFLDQKWQEPTGLADHIVGGLSGQVLPEVCSSTLMTTLRAEEEKRQSEPEEYTAAVRKVLEEDVLQGDWVHEKIEEHCGPAPSRLFESQIVGLSMRGRSWVPVASAILGATALSLVTAARILRSRDSDTADGTEAYVE